MTYHRLALCRIQPARATADSPPSATARISGNDLGIRAGEVIAIQIEERDHGQESDALVAVTVRVIPDQAKGMGCRERRQIRPGGILPFLSRAGQCGFERALVTSPGQATVFAQLVVVNGVNDETT